MRIKQLKLLFRACVLALSVAQTADGVELPQELIDCRAMASTAARLDCYDQLVDAQTASTNHPAETGTAEKALPAAAAAEPAANVSQEAPFGKNAEKVLPAAAAVTTAATETKEPAANISPEDLFGKNQEEIRKSVQEATDTPEINEIEAKVSKLSKSVATGYVVITLDNGQVWKQIDSSKLRLSDNDQVTIRRASFGSFMLKKTGRNTTMRVKRIS